MIEFTVNGEPRVIFLRHVPLFALGIGLLSLLIPLTVWALRRNGWISETTQRRIVAGWLGTLIVGIVVAWAVWAMDYIERRRADTVTPWVYGVLIAIAIVALLTPAWRRHRQDAEVRAGDVGRGLLNAILQVGIFWFWFNAALVLVLWFALPSNAPLAFLFIPPSLLFLVLALAVGLYLVVPRLIRGGFSLWQEMQHEIQQERAFVESCAGSDEQLLKLAEVPILRAIAYRLRCDIADLSELNIDRSQLRRVGEACWLVAGSVRVRPSVGPSVEHYWRASLEIAMGKLRANVVAMAVGTLPTSQKTLKPV